MIGKNPPIGSKGIFELKDPFKADPKVTYTLQATRSFAELISAKIDPFVLVYETRGLDASIHYYQLVMPLSMCHLVT